MKVVAAGEGVEDAEEGGGSIAQVQLQKPIVIAVGIILLLLIIIVIVTLTNRVMMIISRRF